MATPAMMAAPKTLRPVLEVIRWQANVDQVQGGLDESNAVDEAGCCPACGNRFKCDNC